MIRTSFFIHRLDLSTSNKVLSLFLYLLVFLNLFCFSQPTIAQKTTPQPTSFQAIDTRAKNTPSELLDLKDIVSYITKGLTTDTQKVRAFYSWIAYHITYDVYRSKQNIEDRPNYASDQEIVQEVLDRRQGVCMHYAHLFIAMCDLVGIKAHYIRGYTRDADGEI